MYTLEEAIPQIRELITQVGSVSQRRQCATSLRNALPKLHHQIIPVDLITDILSVLTELVYSDGDETAGPAVVALGSLFAQELFPKDSQDFVWDIIYNTPSNRPNMSMDHTLSALTKLAGAVSLGEEKAAAIYSIVYEEACSPIPSASALGVRYLGRICAAREYDEEKANEVLNLMMNYALDEENKRSSDVRSSSIQAMGSLMDRTLIPVDRLEAVIDFMTSRPTLFQKEKCIALNEMMSVRDRFPTSRLLDAYKFGRAILPEDVAGDSRSAVAGTCIPAIAVMCHSCARKDFPCLETCDSTFEILVRIAQKAGNDELKVQCLTGLSKLMHNRKLPRSKEVLGDIITLAMRKTVSRVSSVHRVALQVLCRLTYRNKLPEERVNSVAHVLLRRTKEPNTFDVRKWAVSGLRDMAVSSTIKNSNTLESVSQTLLNIALVDKKAAPLEKEYALRGIGVFIENDVDRFKASDAGRSIPALAALCTKHLEEEVGDWNNKEEEKQRVTFKTLSIHIVGVMLKHGIYPTTRFDAKRMLRLFLVHVDVGEVNCTITTLWALSRWIPCASFPGDKQSTINVANLLVKFLDSQNLQFRALDALGALFIRKDLLAYLTDTEYYGKNDDDNARAAEAIRVTNAPTATHNDNDENSNSTANSGSNSKEYKMSFAAQIKSRVQEKYEARDAIFKCGGNDPLPETRCTEVTENMERILGAL